MSAFFKLKILLFKTFNLETYQTNKNFRYRNYSNKLLTSFQLI